jgi:hypothetical protein
MPYFTDLTKVYQSERQALSGASQGTGLGDEIEDISTILASFPDALFDLREAGNCFGCERFTASVYHLMRVAEYGLVATAASAGVPEEHRTDWSKMISGIYSKIKLLSSQKPPNWKEEETKYSELCSWFEVIAKGWRNPVSHVPRVYSETSAKNIFAGIRELFGYLGKQGIKQVQVPSAPITPP